VAETLRAMDDPGWLADLEPARTLAGVAPDAPNGAPVLAAAVLPLDPARAGRLLTRLAAAAGLPRFRPSREEAVTVLEAALRLDGRLAPLAAAAGMDHAALRVIAQLAATPLLYAARRALAGARDTAWPHGYCPVCGAWPVLAEVRGIERRRSLRCGRCGASWDLAGLQCGFCGERAHERLSALVPEDQRDPRRVETCHACRAYLKSVPTLRPTPPDALFVLDVETAELDVAAVERGFTRPTGLGHPIAARVVAAAR
jgi:FdhE protein